ncbi:Deuterolysin metalloprotease family-domain-containing protein [Stachybotrys elegans]|uniref:Neutral protease 2 n=1 Tax=Stachybotrys elegans TaxID=80388 RepID=A0A8K0SD50_9HYPO|nr:Deuterolysin metalloprotease family-domain-containing protein [Stachybotrys elegans]
MKFFSCIFALASVAMAAPMERSGSALDVKLEMVGNTNVKVVITNTGASNLRLLKTGSILGHVPTQRLTVSSNSEALEFDGPKLYISPYSLTSENFQEIAASESVEVTIDIAEVYDLSRGGSFKISGAGSIGYAEANSTTLVGTVQFKAADIEAEIDGDEAAFSRIAFHQKRTQKRAILTECSGDKLAIAERALGNCVTLARGAASAAASGPAAKMEEYFKSSSDATRATVTDVFNRIISECGSTNAGVSRMFCSDPYNYCSSATAYTVPWESYTAFCDSWFFGGWEDLSGTCHQADRASIALHEMTHLSEIKGTDDYSCYGYDCVLGLTPEQNINHADTYLNFANAIYVGC